MYKTTAAHRRASAKYNKTKKAKDQRVNNTRARRKAQREGWDKKGDGKDVAHLNNDATDNSAKNLAHQSPSKNRSFKRDKNAHRARSKKKR